MNKAAEYLTPASVGESLIIEKKSKFYGICAPVTGRNKALEFIDEVRNRHGGADHNVWAYHLREGNLSHCSDNGEPSGTAGRPALGALQKAGIIDAVVVVTRYFGGTLLGTGGLTGAYSSAAVRAIKAAGTAVMTLCRVYSVVIDYPLYDRIIKLYADNGYRTDSPEFTGKVTLYCTVKATETQAFLDMTREISRAAATVVLIKEEFMPYDIK